MGTCLGITSEITCNWAARRRRPYEVHPLAVKPLVGVCRPPSVYTLDLLSFQRDRYVSRAPARASFQ